MAAAGRAQQRGAALRVRRIDRESQIQQAAHRVGVADHRRRRQVGGSQRAARQRPATPVQPIGQIAAAAGQRHTQRSLAVGGAGIRTCALGDQLAQRKLAAQCGGQVQRGHAVAVAGFAIHADVQQAVQQSRPTQPHCQRQRRVAQRRSREGIGAAFQQIAGELFQSTPDLLAARAGVEEARQSTGTRRRGRAAQQHLHRGHGFAATRQQCEQRRVAGRIQRVHIRALCQQPLQARRRQSDFGIVQQRAQLLARRQPGQRREFGAGAIRMQPIPQQRDRRAIRRRLIVVAGTHRRRQRIGSSSAETIAQRPASAARSTARRPCASG